jgi:hypothetical protein
MHFVRDFYESCASLKKKSSDEDQFAPEKGYFCSAAHAEEEDEHLLEQVVHRFGS